MVLLVEDNRDLAETVGAYFEAEHYSVDYSTDGLTAVELASAGNFDAIILDINLPGIDGLEVCRRLRRDIRIATPIIMLTARDQLEDKITGFDVGADDYLVKPFDMRELAARVDALIRRDKGGVSETVYRVGDLELDTAREVALRAGKRVSLSPRSFDILKILMRESPNVVSRAQLERELWGEEPPDSDALRSHMYNLRRVADKPFKDQLIETVAGRGFRISDERSQTEL